MDLYANTHVHTIPITNTHTHTLINSVNLSSWIIEMVISEPNVWHFIWSHLSNWVPKSIYFVPLLNCFDNCSYMWCACLWMNVWKVFVEHWSGEKLVKFNKPSVYSMNMMFIHPIWMVTFSYSVPIDPNALYWNVN